MKVLQIQDNNSHRSNSNHNRYIHSTWDWIPLYDGRYTARNLIALQLICNLWVTWIYLKLINYTSSGYSKFQIYNFVILKDLRRTGWHSMHSLSLPFSWLGLLDIFSFVILLPVYSILLSPFLSVIRHHPSPFGCSVAMQSISSSLRGLFIHNHNRCLLPLPKHKTIDWPDSYIYTSLYKLMCVYVCVLEFITGPPCVVIRTCGCCQRTLEHLICDTRSTFSHWPDRPN